MSRTLFAASAFVLLSATPAFATEVNAPKVNWPDESYVGAWTGNRDRMTFSVNVPQGSTPLAWRDVDGNDVPDDGEEQFHAELVAPGGDGTEMWVGEMMLLPDAVNDKLKVVAVQGDVFSSVVMFPALPNGTPQVAPAEVVAPAAEVVAVEEPAAAEEAAVMDEAPAVDETMPTDETDTQ